MSIDDFIKLHKYILLENFLKDKDINLSLYYNFNELEVWDDSALKYNPPPTQKPNIINKEELEHLINSRDEKYLEEQYLYSESELNVILNKLKDLKFISSAKGILWSSRIIEEFSNYWDWSKLSENKSIFR